MGRYRLPAVGRPFDFVYMNEDQPEVLARMCGIEPHHNLVGDLTPHDAFLINHYKMFSASDFNDSVGIRKVPYRRNGKNLLVFFVWGCASAVCDFLGLEDVEVIGGSTDLPSIYIIAACDPKNYVPPT